jgi:hypothetical protein
VHAVTFDTTFKTNKFEMPFALILGCNHHKQTIIFGCALLFNETIESFVWLFETFLTAMSGTTRPAVVDAPPASSELFCRAPADQRAWASPFLDPAQ